MPADNLFRGPGWSDGVAAYPDEYADAGGSSGILDWPKHNPGKVSKPGYGIPMKALSTNCLYYNAYVTAEKMAVELKAPVDPRWKTKAARLKEAINSRPLERARRATIDSWSDHSETAIFRKGWGRPTPCSSASPIRNRPRPSSPASMSRPLACPVDGRTCGDTKARTDVVWTAYRNGLASNPGFWAEAAARAGKPEVFGHELFNLAAHAVRDKQFAEIYHPVTGQIYGGLQENGKQGIILWQATSRQTWAATAYLRMILLGLAGMRFDADGIRFQPCVPKGISSVELRNVNYRSMNLDLTIRGTGTTVKQCLINGKESRDRRLAAQAEGSQKVSIVLTDR